jgi:Leucine-rich repeat (LRR) protein
MDLFRSGVSSAMDVWSQHTALEDDMQKLLTTLSVVRILIDKTERWRFKDENLSRLLIQLKDAAFDAEDMLDEYNYQKSKITGAGQASQILSSASSFAKNLISRTVKKVNDIQERLDHVSTKLEHAVRLLDLDQGPNHNGKFIKRETSSFIAEPEIIGRDEEKEQVISLLLQSSGSTKSGNANNCAVKKGRKDVLSVLPIVGIGGVGKTTLAQLVYNDERVQKHFNLKSWIHVIGSNHLDIMGITREIVGFVHEENVADCTNLDALQKMLKEKVMSKRTFIVFDDVWNDDSMEWHRLCAPLQYAHSGSMILVTTRFPKVAGLVGTMEPIILEGLKDDVFWDFFKRCAFHSGYSTDRHAELEKIDRRVAAKLKGSPLAAKTLGGMLKSDLVVRHWRAIMNSEIWQLQQDEGDILPVLQLSYQYLPMHLKQCFSFCSIFTKNSRFDKDMLISMWMAEGFILPQGDLRVEDIGRRYLNELISRSFFENHPHYPGQYIIHDLMHDLAKFVSMDECLCIQPPECQSNLPTTVRHLSITEPMEMIEFGGCKRLRSFAYFGSAMNLSCMLLSWFNELTNLRMLTLRHCNIDELHERISNLKHLQYLDISHTKITELPESFCQLHNLQTLDIKGCELVSFPQGFTNLINLRRIYASIAISSKITGIGKLTSLQNLSEFEVQTEQGFQIKELKNMNQLEVVLHIRGLEHVRCKEDAMQANLNSKKYIEELNLEWSSGSSSDQMYIKIDEEVLEELQPHSNIKQLTIRCYQGVKSPTWLQAQSVPFLTGFQIENCPNLKDLPNIPSSLSMLQIERCSNLKDLKQILLPHHLPAIKSICVSSCLELVSLPADSLSGFSFLEHLEVRDCPDLPHAEGLSLPPSLKRLILDSCGEIDMSLPKCLEGLTSLVSLEIYNCPHVISMPKQVLIQLKALQQLTICNCKELRNLDGVQHVSSLEEITILRCPKLVESGSCTYASEQKMVAMMRLESLYIDDTSILRLLFLWNPPSSLKTLEICYSSELAVFTGEGEAFLQSLKSLSTLRFEQCANLRSLPEMYCLTSLQCLEIEDCPEIESMPKKGLPTSLTNLVFSNCHLTLTEKLTRHKRLMNL